MNGQHGGSGLALTFRAPTDLVDRLLDLALSASRADRAALFLLDADGFTLTCQVARQAGRRAADSPTGSVSLEGIVREALCGGEAVVVSDMDALPPAWAALAPHAAVLAPLTTPEGPLGLLVLGWTQCSPPEGARDSATTAAASLATVLEAAIEAEVARSLTFHRERVVDGGLETAARALAAIYLRVGLLRLVLEGDLAVDAREIESLARVGIAALSHDESEFLINLSD